MVSSSIGAGSRPGQGNGKGAPAARLAFDAHAAVVGGDDELHDAQPQAAAAAAPGQALVHLEEPFEDALGVARGQADAVVLHREEDAAVLGARRSG